MDASSDDLSFVNRTSELAFLESLLDAPGARLVIVRSPPGYGKTRLTDEFARRLGHRFQRVVSVDPLIRQGVGGARLYDGFFVQKCAIAFDEFAKTRPDSDLPSFGAFLGGRRWASVRSKRLGEALQQIPTWGNLYKFGYEYLERYFLFGRQKPAELLGSDQRDAVAACQAYVEHAVTSAPSLLLLRQAQHLDHESLKSLLTVHRANAGNLLIIEYTASDGRFEADHDKLFERELRGHPQAHIYQLLRLKRDHVAGVLSQLNLPSQIIEASGFAAWDGNLRQLREFPRLIGVHDSLGSDLPPKLLSGPPDMATGLQTQIEDLSTTERLLLAAIAVHQEAIPRAVLLAAVRRLAAHTTEAVFDRRLETLVMGGLVVLYRDEVSLAHEDIWPVLPQAAGFGAALGLAEAALRDYYVEIFTSGESSTVAHSVALRRALTLSVRTRDPQLLLQLIDRLDDEVSRTNDQGLYVDAICSALSDIEDLLPDERRRLVAWGAGLAYDICDFRACQTLLEALPDQGPLERAISAQCLTELGEHVRAAALADAIRQADGNSGLADITDGGIALDCGDWPKLRTLLESVVADGKATRSPLVGHALRLLPEILDFPQSTQTALLSVEWFESLGLKRSAAYSALSASRFLAREGRIAEAREMIDKAASVLSDFVRDEHIVRNNRALVELLSAEPDFDGCVADLQLALRTSRDDFSDLTLLTNLAISQWEAGGREAALDCVAQAGAILDDPDFAERDVLWPVCHNLGWVLDEAGRTEEAAAMRRRPRTAGWSVRSNDAYWAFRYGEAPEPDPRLAHLHARPYHPTALSHWQIDRDVLAALTATSPRSPADRSTPGS